MRKKKIFILILTAMLCSGCKASGSTDEAVPMDTPAETSQEGTPLPTAEETPGNEDIPADEEVLEPTDTPSPELLDTFQPICQYPELPTGCEITSLTMVLNHNGIPAGKCDLADNYLDKGEVGTVDFRIAFEGNPRDENSYGCYAPVVTNTANKYLQSVQAGLTAIDLSGIEFEGLFPYIDQGIPVIVWGTLDCAEGHYSVTWNIDGADLTWYTPEHCMVLVGYEDSRVWVADPVHGDIRDYDRNIFRDRYEALYKQAVVIQ